jgi:membrane protease YdiL (CAAX protease family)
LAYGENLVKFGKRNYNYFKLMAVGLIFLLLNFDPDLSMVYLLILIGDYIWYQNDKFISFPFSRKDENQTITIIESFAAFGVFLGITAALITGFSTQSLLSMLSSTVPILADSQLLTLISWGIIVPIIETNFFFGRLLEGFSVLAEKITGKKVSTQKFSIPLFIVMMFVSAVFTLFHLSAKGLGSQALIVTFIFGILSMILVVRHRSTKGATIMHILSNSIAVLISMGWLGGLI